MRSDRLLAAAALTFLTGSTLVLSGAQGGSPPPVQTEAQLIEDLVASNRILHQQGINDAFGHVSVRSNQNPSHYYLARSLAPDLVTAADLIEYDLDSNPVNLNGRDQYSERYIHGEIYKTHPEIHAVVHNHSQDVIPFSISTVRLRPVFHVASFLGEGVPVFDIRNGFGMTDMLITDSARGAALAKVLAGNPAVLMRGHGATVVGPSLPYAVGRSVYLSFNARVQAQAMALGGPVAYLDPAEAKAYLTRGESRGYERPWESWRKQAVGR